MKKILLFSGCAAASLIFTGCNPDLAETQFGAEEQRWQQVINDSYSGFRPPRTAPPATVDNASPDALEKQRARERAAEAAKPAVKEDTAEQQAAPSPIQENDPAKAVDSAAAKSEGETQEAAPAEKKPAEAEVKKEGAAQEAKAEKAEAKAEEAPKAEKTEAKAAETAPKAEEAKEKSELEYETYVVKSGDTLGKIAQKFYGKASFYEVIQKANPQIKDPKQIRIGTKLRIPKL